MSGFVQGRGVRFMIGDGQQTETYLTIGGETNLSYKTSPDKVDLSSKDDGAYKSGAYGPFELAFSISGKVKITDAGLTRVQAASLTPGTLVDVKILNGTFVMYQGTCAIGPLSFEAPDAGVCTYTFEAMNVGVPTTNNIQAQS